MKKTFLIYFCFVAIQIASSKLLVAQENVQAKKMIVGKWKFYKTETLNKEDQLRVDKQIEALNENGCYFEYKANGTWECKFWIIDRNTMNSGRWELSADGKVLTSIFPSGERASVNIVELTHNKMVEEVNGIKNTYIK